MNKEKPKTARAVKDVQNLGILCNTTGNIKLQPLWEIVQYFLRKLCIELHMIQQFYLEVYTQKT